MANADAQSDMHMAANGHATPRTCCSVTVTAKGRVETLEAECLYPWDTKLAFFNLDCYQVNMLIATPKVTSNKIIQTYRERKNSNKEIKTMNYTQNQSSVDK